jgi:hypothetical protein
MALPAVNPVIVLLTPLGKPVKDVKSGPGFWELMFTVAVAGVPSCEIVSAEGETVAEIGGVSVTAPPLLPPHPEEINARESRTAITRGRMYEFQWAKAHGNRKSRYCPLQL